MRMKWLTMRMLDVFGRLGRELRQKVDKKRLLESINPRIPRANPGGVHGE